MRVLLVDDDEELTVMLAEYLRGEGFEADAVGTAMRGKDAALSGRYAAVLLDVMLPGGNGIDALRDIRRRSEIPIIMLTAKGSDTERVLGLELGADDYVTKPYFAPELVARLRAVLRRPARGTNASIERLTFADLEFDGGRRSITWRGTAMDLTPTEFNLFEALLRAEGRVSTKDELSLRILGRRRLSYDRSIEMHVSNLRQKIERVTLGAVRIETIRSVGWRIQV
ncbi:two-component system, OmpR family, response regulator [Sphingobium sp. AP50]|uniref:response regulator transcription factor n=1 Tax=Sphingobium sp. AP50 TaxID=1884369 RepID=UPI0008C7048C|nr:response regulator transcription factor [Sphingobium sp. AP50]SEK06560.1 two-component system, OmpR family, response regulator [Sphingobium sp. AP50]